MLPEQSEKVNTIPANCDLTSIPPTNSVSALLGITPEIAVKSPGLLARRLLIHGFQRVHADPKDRFVIVLHPPSETLLQHFLGFYTTMQYYRYCIGLDIEHQRITPERLKYGLRNGNDNGEEEGKEVINDVVVYGIALTDNKLKRLIQVSIIMRTGQRLSFPYIVKFAFNVLGVPIKKIKEKILVMWHYGTAEAGSTKFVKQHFNHKKILDIRGCVLSKGSIRVSIPVDKHRHMHRITCDIRDSLALADANTSLKQLGESVGRYKGELPDGAIQRQRTYLERKTYEAIMYNIGDSPIPLLWGAVLTRFMHEMGLRRKHLPMTTGQLAIMVTEKIMTNLHGKGWRRRSFHTVNNRKTKTWELTGSLADNVGIATGKNGGGLNGVKRTGTERGKVEDWDFNRYYAVIMAGIKVLINIPPKTDNDVTELTMPWHYARCFYSMPTDLPIPIISQSTEYGMIPVYITKALGIENDPTDGSVILNGLEIQSIRRHGGTVNPISSAAFYVKEDEYLLAPALKIFLEKRAFYEKEENLAMVKVYKLMGNSLYGKLLQGLARRASLNAIFGDTDGKVDMTPCKFTNPYYGYMVTAIGRLALAEAINILETYCKTKVVNYITDGTAMVFHVDTDTTEMMELFHKHCKDVPVFEYLRNAQRQLGIPETEHYVKVAHRGDTITNLKTRTYSIKEGDRVVQEPKSLFARANKPEEFIPIEILDQHRKANIPVPQRRKHLARLKHIIQGKVCDPVSYSRSSNVSMQPDPKCLTVPLDTDGNFQSVYFHDNHEMHAFHRAYKPVRANASPQVMYERLSQPLPVQKPLSEKRLDREILHRVATKVPGWELPPETTVKKAAKVLKTRKKWFASVATERHIFHPLPVNDARVMAKREALGLPPFYEHETCSGEAQNAQTTFCAFLDAASHRLSERYKGYANSLSRKSGDWPSGQSMPTSIPQVSTTASSG